MTLDIPRNYPKIPATKNHPNPNPYHPLPQKAVQQGERCRASEGSKQEQQQPKSPSSREVRGILVGVDK